MVEKMLVQFLRLNHALNEGLRVLILNCVDKKGGTSFRLLPVYCFKLLIKMMLNPFEKIKF